MNNYTFTSSLLLKRSKKSVNDKFIYLSIHPSSIYLLYKALLQIVKIYGFNKDYKYK